MYMNTLILKLMIMVYDTDIMSIDENKEQKYRCKRELNNEI